MAQICKTEPLNVPKRKYDMQIVCIRINKLHNMITGAFKCPSPSEYELKIKYTVCY